MAFLMPNDCPMIFGGSVAYDSKRRQKVACREVYTTKPAMPTFLRWSESAITFDRADHLNSVPYTGRYPLIVNPIVGPKRLTKVLMYGGTRRDGRRPDTPPPNPSTFPRRRA